MASRYGANAERTWRKCEFRFLRRIVAAGGREPARYTDPSHKFTGDVRLSAFPSRLRLWFLLRNPRASRMQN
jgi:hypothetical protein